jgi:hypothetical protein
MEKKLSRAVRIRLRTALIAIAALAVLLYYVAVPIVQHYTLSPSERRERFVLGQLEKAVDMPFGEPASLEQAIKYIKGQTQISPPLLERMLDALDARFLPSKPLGGTYSQYGIPIYIDPVGLQEAGVTMQAPITLRSTGAPLKTSLHAILNQLQLDYQVEGGLMTITSVWSLDRPLPPARTDSRDSSPAGYPPGR